MGTPDSNLAQPQIYTKHGYRHLGWRWEHQNPTSPNHRSIPNTDNVIQGGGGNTRLQPRPTTDLYQTRITSFRAEVGTPDSNLAQPQIYTKHGYRHSGRRWEHQTPTSPNHISIPNTDNFIQGGGGNTRLQPRPTTDLYQTRITPFRVEVGTPDSNLAQPQIFTKRG